MARQESDREDLLREATALVERIEFAPADPLSGEHTFVGFRPDGAMSIYFGDDPVYQFNAAGQLRRAFAEGQMIKAVGGRLIALRRVRTPEEVQLVRYDLPVQEQELLLATVTTQLQHFVQQLGAGRYAVVDQVPAESNVLARVRTWFDNHTSLQVAHAPNAQ